MAQATYYLNEYIQDQEYGGPEEGGWWFNTYEFVKCHGQFVSFEMATEARDGLDSYLTRKRDGLHPPYSVLSEGEWPVLYVEDHPGRDRPAVRPRYE